MYIFSLLSYVFSVVAVFEKHSTVHKADDTSQPLLAFKSFFKNTQKQTTWTLRHRRSGVRRTWVDTNPSLPVKCREIIRSRLSLIHRGGGREKGRTVQKLIISHVGFLCPPSFMSRWLMVEIFNCTQLTDMHQTKAAKQTSGGTRQLLL